MTELAAAGFGKTAQVTIPALLYGLVHAAWGFSSGMFTLQMMGSAIIGTAVFGVFCSILYEPWLFMIAITMSHTQ